MTVHFIGAGPGAADLLTLRGARLIAESPVCLYAGALIPDGVLTHARGDARLVDTQSLSLDEIIGELAAAHADGLDVARLQSGDLSVYSALTEQVRRLDELGVPWDLTPGVPAFAAASAALRQELTRPGQAQAVILARYGRNATTIPAGERLAELAVHGTTLAIHLGIQAIDEIVEILTPFYAAGCPVAVVARASWPDEIVLRGTLASIAGDVASAEIRGGAIILVGPGVVDRSSRLSDETSHLYANGRYRPSRRVEPPVAEDGR